jgi:hypothetical protein
MLTRVTAVHFPSRVCASICEDIRAVLLSSIRLAYKQLVHDCAADEIKDQLRIDILSDQTRGTRVLKNCAYRRAPPNEIGSAETDIRWG